MRLASQVSPEKLRGGFYSPPELVRVCLDRVAELLGDRTALTVLEPSAGDGAFLRGLAVHPLCTRLARVTAVELVAVEAAACRTHPFAEVRQASFLDGSVTLGQSYDAVVGNPPFVRFQFVDAAERRRAETVAQELGIVLGGVSNLWLPIVLKALSCLRPGGVFALIIPAEFLTGVSASVARGWLLRHTRQLRIDLFPPNSFPGVLQEVVVLSGRRGDGQPLLTVGDRGRPAWEHRVDADCPTWTRYLLTPAHLAAMDEAAALPGCIPLGEAARFRVAIVTGANDFFTVDAATVEHFGLHAWARPLLPRIRRAPGLVLTDGDYDQVWQSGTKAALLDFAAGDDPRLFAGAREYLRSGVESSVDLRYKCRIRSPWYRVPIQPPAELLLSKRSHLYPRVVLNAARVATTDTIYQGRVTPSYRDRATAVAASFHNSLTTLCAEIEGRSFGGGVLELVPSEVARLRTFVRDELAEELAKLDAISRSTDTDRDQMLIEETDRRLAKCVPGLGDALLSTLADARRVLQRRRLERNRQP